MDGQEQFVPMEPFATNLRKRAEALHISNAEVARRAGLTERRYGNYVTGHREPDLASLVRIANALGTTVDSLLGMEVESRNAPALAALMGRLVAAGQTMKLSDLELLVIQAEAIIAARPMQIP